MNQKGTTYKHDKKYYIWKWKIYSWPTRSKFATRALQNLFTTSLVPVHFPLNSPLNNFLVKGLKNIIVTVMVNRNMEANAYLEFVNDQR